MSCCDRGGDTEACGPNFGIGMTGVKRATNLCPLLACPAQCTSVVKGPVPLLPVAHDDATHVDVDRSRATHLYPSAVLAAQLRRAPRSRLLLQVLKLLLHQHVRLAALCWALRK